MKKLICLVVSVVLVAGVFSGCIRGGQKEDPNRTQIYVAIMDDGVKSEWLELIANEYERVNPEYQIIIDVNDGYLGDPLKQSISHDKQDVYFVSYANINDFLNNDLITSNYLADITDIVTEKNDKNLSLHDRLLGGVKDYMNVGTESNPKYFTLPYFMTTRSAIYDADLFEEKNLYNLDEYKGLDGIKGNADDNYGPDGIPSTYDDGLPATWEDMKILLAAMVANNITPFTWSQKDASYRVNWLQSIWANYEGYNDYVLNYSYDGEHINSNLGAVDNTNGYVTLEQEGRKAALEVAKTIASNPSYYSSNAFKTTQTHIQAQLEYIGSKANSSGNNQIKPIAFLIEGGWWENESKSGFDELAADKGEKWGYGKRNFKYFPFPKFIGTNGIKDQVSEDLTVFWEARSFTSMSFVNKNSKNISLAKDFLKFAYSDDMLALFTKTTGIPRAIDYEMSPDDIAEMTPFARSIWEVLKDENAKHVIYPTRNSLRNAARSFFVDGMAFRSTIDGKQCNEPINEFFTNKNLTVQAYFDGTFEEYGETKWKEKLSAYFGN